jgi:hypothetical protein
METQEATNSQGNTQSKEQGSGVLDDSNSNKCEMES